MNNKINIIKNTYILFIVNIVVLISLVFFKSIYTKLGYFPSLVNCIFIFNIIILVIGIIFNILFLKKVDFFDNKKSLITIIIIFIIYLLINTLFVIGINKILGKSYAKINSTLSSYCDNYGCDSYKTITKNGYEEFVVNKSYFDYDNIQNDLTIVTKYNNKKILSVTATVYSRKQMFSETIIKDNLKNYFINFNCNINEEKIREAFDKRFDSSIKDNDVTYKVTEIYNNDGELEKLKTTITLKLNQE